MNKEPRYHFTDKEPRYHFTDKGTLEPIPETPDFKHLIEEMADMLGKTGLTPEAAKAAAVFFVSVKVLEAAQTLFSSIQPLHPSDGDTAKDHPPHA